MAFIYFLFPVLFIIIFVFKIHGFLKFHKKITWSTLSTLSTVTASLVINKLFSVLYGPSGIALLAHLQNIIGIVQSLPQEGINRGIVKYLSGKNPSELEYKGYFSAGVVLQITVSFLSLPILYILLHQINSLPDFLSSISFFSMVAVASFLHVTSTFLLSLLLSAQRVVVFSLLTIINNVFFILLIFSGLLHSLYFGSLALFFGPGIILAFVLYFIIKKQSVFQLHFSKATRLYIRDIGKFILIALSILIFGRLIDFFVRAFVIEKFSVEATGLWQAAVKMSDGYTTVFTGVINIIYFPKLSEIINSDSRINRFIQRSFYQLIPIIIIFLSVILIVQEYVILILFDDHFLGAKPFFTLQIIGDMLKFPAWLIVYIVLAEGNTLKYIYLQIFSAIIYIVFLFFFLNEIGILGAGYAHIVRYFLFLLVVVLLYRKKIF